MSPGRQNTHSPMRTSAENHKRFLKTKITTPLPYLKILTVIF
jgi:hypothetical protein